MTDYKEPVELERGDKVNHPKWGAGTILYKSGSGDQCKVIVLFQDVGQKTLAVKYAKLEKIASVSQKSKGKLVALKGQEEEETSSGDSGESVNSEEDENLALSEDEEEEEDL